MEAPPAVKYTVIPPTDYVDGDIEQFAFYAGMSCALTNEILPAREIVRRIAAEAREIIAKRLAPLA
jgi:hypothetical protein